MLRVSKPVIPKALFQSLGAMLCLLTAMSVGHSCRAWSHEHPSHHVPHESARIVQAETAETQEGISGQGVYRFRVWKERSILPQAAQEVLKKAHGGFAVDRREGRGEVYFALPGAGIIRLSRDLTQAEMVATDDAVKNTNLHNTTIWYGDENTAWLVFPANNAGKVFTTALDGTLLDTLNAPTPEIDFDHPEVNTYFAEGGAFVPTDVEYLNRLYYITTGYSKLDYVLTAQVTLPPLVSEWFDLAFGGKGDEPGQFQTGHGITVAMDGKRLDIADRPVAQIERFDRFGHYRETITLPQGAYPCDIDHAAGLSIVPCLHGPNRDLGAPIYILQDGEVVATIMPKAELGLERFQHLHNAVLVKRNDKLYIIAQSWNPGDFAILEQVK